ncbi:MFS transporter [Paraburkholderia acidicola]|uniref:MFS transporter n=1 Tax=Paraburkholderia acidicola TaxID=1912599 RepID=A0A2A4ESA5_9BURK|nr:MFS transporter [Paraburkholderia acidicola]
MVNAHSRRIVRIQRLAVGFLLVAGIVNYLDRSALSIANVLIREELGLSTTQMGLLLSVFSIAYAIGQIPSGALLDRLGVRVVLGVGMFLWSIAQTLSGFTHTVRGLLLCRFFLGVSEAPLVLGGVKVVNDWFNFRHRGLPTALVAVSQAVSSTFAPMILTAIMLAFGWRIMFAIMGVLGIMVAVGWLLIYRDRSAVELTASEQQYLDENRTGGDVGMRPTRADWIGLFRQRTTWGMVFGFMGIVYMVWLFMTWLPGYLETTHHLSIARTGGIAAIPFACGALGQLLGGAMIDALIKRGVGPIDSRKWLICAGLVVAALLTAPAAFATNLWVAVALISGAVGAINLAGACAWALVNAATPSRLVASLGAIQNCGGFLGGSLAPWVTGWVVNRTGSFFWALLVSSAACVLSALSYACLVRKPIHEHKDGATIVSEPAA